jgi:hypothetical protein
LVAVAALLSSSSAQALVSLDLRAAAKAAIGVLELRQKNMPRPGVTTITKADRLLQLPFGPVLITRVDIDSASHAESGALGIYYLKRTAGGYLVQKRWPRAVDGVSFGYSPEWRATANLTKFPAIYATGGWTGQGYTCGWAVLAELTPSGPIISDTIYNSYSDAGVGANTVHEFDGRISNIRKGRAFDVIASGTSRFAEHYTFRRDRFVRTEKESRFQC